MTAFVIGNGTSRRSLNLESLRGKGTIYGCNALYRDFHPDVLVVLDEIMAYEIARVGYAKENTVYTRWWESFETTQKNLDGIEFKPEFEESISSGSSAMQLAIDDGHKDIYAIGHDCIRLPSGKINNVYAGTFNYKDTRTQQGDLSKSFGGELLKIGEKNHDKNINLIRVVAEPAKAEDYLEPYWQHITMQEFVDKFDLTCYTTEDEMKKAHGRKPDVRYIVE